MTLTLIPVAEAVVARWTKMEAAKTIQRRKTRRRRPDRLPPTRLPATGGRIRYIPTDTGAYI
jgi:hypothetical protein